MHVHLLRHDMIKREDLGVKDTDIANGRVRRTADDVAETEVHGIDVREVEDGQHSRHRPVRRLAIHLDGPDGGGRARGLDQDRVADLEGAGLDAARDGKRVGDAAAEDVGDGHAERLFDTSLHRFGGIEFFDEGGARIPWCGGFGDRSDNVLAGETGARDEVDGRGLEAGRGEKGGHLLLDFFEACLGPGDRVHLVDGYDDALDSDGADEESVLFCLSLQA